MNQIFLLVEQTFKILLYVLNTHKAIETIGGLKVKILAAG